jgi:hypothetical protein
VKMAGWPAWSGKILFQLINRMAQQNLTRLDRSAWRCQPFV